MGFPLRGLAETCFHQCDLHLVSPKVSYDTEKLSEGVYKKAYLGENWLEFMLYVHLGKVLKKCDFA